MQRQDVLTEERRSDLTRQARKADKYAVNNRENGASRFERRLKQKISSSTKELNKIDMNKLFKDDILDINIKVLSESDPSKSYLVRLKFGGVIDLLSQEVQKTKVDTVDYRNVQRALIKAFNSENVYVSCSCNDWRYRMGYFATLNDINSGEPETIPSVKTNPKNTKGSGCKHVLKVLFTTEWLMAVGRVINNYIHYIEKHDPELYSTIIDPVIFRNGKFETNLNLDSDEETINTSNKYAKTKTLKQYNKKEKSTETKEEPEEAK